MLLTRSSCQPYEPWLEFRTPAVRQLAFSICSPSIIAEIPEELPVRHAFELHDHSFWTSHFQNYRNRLEYLDHHPEELLQFLAQLKSTRLGLRFEMLIWFWLLDCNYHSYQLLGHSIQQIAGAITLGELDFLVRNTETDEIEHWEVALKYYLGEADLSLPNWYGLNRSDTMLRKLKHFTDKQFQFRQTLNLPVQRRFAVLKGQLYIPLHVNNATLPHWINSTRKPGQWGYEIPDKSHHYHRLERQEWICPNQHASSSPATWWLDGLYYEQQSGSHFMFRNKSLMYIHI